MRSTWGVRLLVAVLVTSLLPTLVGPVTGGDRHGGSASYGDWLRAQMRVSPDKALEEALEVAVAAQAKTLQRFLSVFVQAYEARNPEGQLAHAFLAHDLSNDALITDLQLRYMKLGDGLIPRSRLDAARSVLVKAADRSVALWAVVAGAHIEHATSRLLSQSEWGRFFILPLRLLSAAQPLGP